MLRELTIRNLAVLEEAKVAFAAGLNVLTGETGAGKSIVIDALLLIRGARVQADLIRTGAGTASVEAVFELPPPGPVAAVLDEAGHAPADGQLVIKRELSLSGRHRVFVNDSAATVGLLERLGDLLVELHGQHEHQRLVEPARQLELLDRFAECLTQRERVDALVRRWEEARASLARLRAELAESPGRGRPGPAGRARVEARRHRKAQAQVRRDGGGDPRPPGGHRGGAHADRIAGPPPRRAGA